MDYFRISIKMCETEDETSWPQTTHIYTFHFTNLAAGYNKAFFLLTSSYMKDGQTLQTSTFPLNYGASWRRGGENYARRFKYGTTAFK
jgi:hypothetical protein